MQFTIVVAATARGGIGIDGKLPWNLPSDKKYFQELTTFCSNPEKRNAVIMGRKTFESIPPRFRPLPNRLNVVVSRQRKEHDPPNLYWTHSFSSALDFLKQEQMNNIETVFVIGGQSIYMEALQHPHCQHVSITHIYKEWECDTFFPPLNRKKFEVDFIGELQLESSSQVIRYTRRHEEYQYLDIVSDIMAFGNFKIDRTKIGTFSQFGHQMRFSLRNGSFPLLTTKKVFWKGIVEELLWFISGSTDAKKLSAKRVKIWDGNGARDVLDKLGFPEREEGDLGPIYGHQWRHFGAPYKDCHTNYDGQGTDQLQEVIETIRNNPESRRILISAWNAADLKSMALPPCHVLCQFYVFEGELSCIMYQRSGDLGLGVPFNIASYSLLTCLLAHVCDLTPGEFIHVLGDTHVYKTHITALKDQILRKPRPFPNLQICSEKKRIEEFVAEDFILSDYHPHEGIKMDMAV
jgi:dihydrofolate reductase/thymidylate synthase